MLRTAAVVSALVCGLLSGCAVANGPDPDGRVKRPLVAGAQGACAGQVGATCGAPPACAGGGGCAAAGAGGRAVPPDAGRCGKGPGMSCGAEPECGGGHAPAGDGYELDADDAGRIIGGEWLGARKSSHPDFLWSPTPRPPSVQPGAMPSPATGFPSNAGVAKGPCR